MSRIGRLLGFTLLLAWPLILFAAGPQGKLPFVRIGPEQGLTSSALTCLVQDQVGFLWVGTENGLIRYEAGNCRQWTLQDGLPSAWIQRLLPDPQGGLWVGTNKGLVHFKDGRIEAARLEGSASLASAQDIALDGAGRLWLKSAEGCFIQEQGTRFRRLAEPKLEGATALVAGPRSGWMYFAGPEGVSAYLQDGSTRSWGSREGLPEGRPQILVEDGLGRLWAGRGRTLKMKAAGSDRFQDRSTLLGASLTPNSTPFLDQDGSVWLPTLEGALHIAGDKIEHLGLEQGLPFKWVRSLFRDSQASLWVLGPHLVRLQGGERLRNHAVAKGGMGGLVWFILRNRAGSLLAGTDDGVYRLGPAGFVRLPGTEGRRIKYLAEDAAGTLWMASTTGPALWLRPGRPRAELAPVGPLGTAAFSVKVDARGRVWMGHPWQGLLRWDPAGGRLVQELGPGFRGRKVFGADEIQEDRSGRLWVGTSAGVLVGSPESGWKLFTEADGLLPGFIHGLAPLEDGSVWIHGMEALGLMRVRVDGDRLEVLERRGPGQGLRSGMVYAVRADARGQVWATTDLGLERLSPPLQVGTKDGMDSEDCTIHGLYPDRDTLWIGTANGLTSLDLTVPEKELPAPTIQISDLSFGGTHLEFPSAPPAPIPHRSATLEFRIGVPWYLGEWPARVQVRLLGLEDGWREAEGRSFRYAALPGGRYRFEARAAIQGEAWGPTTGIELEVLPPWWRTWWALAADFLLLAALVTLLVRWRVASLARSKAALERLVDARTQELSARNQELSEALSRVKQLSGLLPICAHCKKIRDDQGYWKQLEHYISDHSEADFSHGVCPECLPVLFPEYDREAGERRNGTPS